MRHPDSDFLYGDDLAAWADEGRLTRLSTAVSRVARPHYVQDALRAEAAQVAEAIRQSRNPKMTRACIEAERLRVLDAKRLLAQNGIDAVNILRKARQDLRGCEVQIEAERATEDPKVFTQIHVHFILTGVNLSTKHIERAIHLSAEKYCSASIMLGKTARMTHTFEIREA